MRWFAAVSLLALVGCLKPDHIEMKPEQLTFNRRGDQVWVRAIFKDSRGKVYTRQAQTWSSSNDAVAKVDNAQKPGNVTAVGPGHATISVKGDGLDAELPVDVITVEKLKVSPIPITLTTDSERVVPDVQALDVNGRPIKGRTPHMKCADEKICNSDGQGIWPAGDPGKTTVTISVEDQTVTVPVIVTKGKGT